MGSKILSKNFKDLDEGTVIEQIIRVAALSYDRLPVMEVTFERYALILAPALKVYTAGTADVTLEGVDYLSCGEALESLDQLSFVMIANTSTNGEKIGVVLSTDLLFNNLEIMLGGGRFDPGPVDKRSFTMIEKRLGTRFCEIALNGLSEAIGQFCEMRFQVDSLESNPRNAMLAPLTTPCIKVVYRVKLGERDGTMSFIVPNTALEKRPRPHLPELSRRSAQPRTGRGPGGRNRPAWRGRLPDRRPALPRDAPVGGPEHAQRGHDPSRHRLLRGGGRLLLEPVDVPGRDRPAQEQPPGREGELGGGADPG